MQSKLGSDVTLEEERPVFYVRPAGPRSKCRLRILWYVQEILNHTMSRVSSNALVGALTIDGRIWEELY